MTVGSVGLAMSVPHSEPVVDRLAALFDAHHERLYKLARRLSNSHDDAKDLVQDTYVRAAQKLATMPTDPGGQEAWLVRVLVNLCRDRWRHRARERRFEQHTETPSAAPSGEAASVARLVIWQALQALSPRRRAIVIMCELEGLSVVDVARTLRLAPVTVRWHLSRGRRELAGTTAKGDRT